jgi:hypothetical protein
MRSGSTVGNLQSNAIIETVYQTIGNTLRTFPKEMMDQPFPWNGNLAATRVTYHTTM